MAEVTKLIHKYLRHDKKFPHVWCPGCGNGIVLGALIRAIDRIGYEKDDFVLVSGIGCSGRLPVYVDFNTLHTTHGRALTFATGIKLAKPRLKVIVVMGDGDAVSIGGNHFIHAARRNIDITAIVMNNRIYGMTGGQYSPLSGYGAKATTAPFGIIDHGFQGIPRTQSLYPWAKRLGGSSGLLHGLDCQAGDMNQMMVWDVTTPSAKSGNFVVWTLSSFQVQYST